MINLHPLTNHNTQNYDLRRHSQLIPLRARTVSFYNSFLLATIRDWNSIPPEIASAKSVSILKTSLKKLYGATTKFVYSLGNGYEKIIHTRLRLQLSGLNQHLFKYNLSLNKFCNQCAGNHIETTEHYLLRCDRYTNSRISLLLGLKNILCPDLNITLLRDLCPTYLCKILIEGSEDLSVNTNLNLFECVFTFIKSTKRFQR